jgi:superfamily II DNA or RNA helicase
MAVLDIFSRSRFILGLSGTPDRNDKKHVMYYNYFDSLITHDLDENLNIKFLFYGIRDR